MGFSIGSLVSDITSVASDPGRLVGDIANSILPGNMRAIGDTLGGLVDLETGHPLQALGHLADTLKDLPQLLQGQASAQAKAAATPAGTAAAEPSPPPSRASTGAPASVPKASGPLSHVSAAIAPGAPTVTVRQVAGETVTRIDDGKTSTIVDQKGGQTTVTIKSDAALGAGGTHPAPASSPAGSATTTVTVASATAATAATTEASAAASTTAKSAGGSSAATSDATGTEAASTTAAAPKDLASLMALGPDQFMQAVTSGKIPPDVANNQSAMMEVQARMNQITQMNQLVTSMMAAMHQMQMSIIQNIRV
jgi:hypothetical protein